MAKVTDKKITLLAENCWVIRSSKTDPLTQRGRTLYIESYKTMVKAPTGALIFPNTEAAERFLWSFHFVWTDGNRKPIDRGDEIFDVVNLYEEVLDSPNGKTITLGD